AVAEGVKESQLRLSCRIEAMQRSGRKPDVQIISARKNCRLDRNHVRVNRGWLLRGAGDRTRRDNRSGAVLTTPCRKHLELLAKPPCAMNRSRIAGVNPQPQPVAGGRPFAMAVQQRTLAANADADAQAILIPGHRQFTE